MFPSIEQFRTTVKKVSDRASHASIPRPTINFTGTVKLHGSNAAVSCSLGNVNSYWAQSRSNIITPEDDNAGFASFVKKEEETFKILLASAADTYFGTVGAGSDQSIISIFGEWCGGNIQKGVALENLPKMFVIFGITVSSGTNDFGETMHHWFDRHEVDTVMRSMVIKLPDGGITLHSMPDTIKCIFYFPTWKIAIDFAAPELVQNKLGEITQAVEECCPVSAALGVNGTGEGVVWSAFACDNPHLTIRLDDLNFKVKGEKHSVSKVKTLASVDVEKISSIKEFVASVVTEARLLQGMQTLKQQGLAITNKNTGAFIKWVTADVIKEEADTITGNGLDLKEIMPVVSRVARDWFLTHLETT